MRCVYRLITPGLWTGVLLAAPAGVTTLINPVDAPAGTSAVICVGETTVKFAAVLLKVTDIAPVKFAPFTTTISPALPLFGT